MQQQISSHRSKALEREKYLLASERNNLEEQRNNLQYGVDELSPSLQRYYLGKIAELDGKFAAPKKRFPMFCGNYDMYYNQMLTITNG